MSNETAGAPLLVSIIELGGYPNFTPLYKRLGCEVLVENSMRKALSLIKRRKPDVIVAEFNFQSDFRDRTSSLESMMAVVQQLPNTRVIVFYEKEFNHQLDKLRERFSFYQTMPYPIDENELDSAVSEAVGRRR